MSSDHRIFTTKIRLSLRKNATRTTITVHYDWSLLNNRDIRDKYALAQRNNAKLEVAAECMSTKQRAKPRVPWERLAVRKKRADVKIASKCNRKNSTNTNSLKLKKAQNELANIYLKEQTEYIQNQIDKIRDSVEDRLSRIAW